MGADGILLIGVKEKPLKSLRISSGAISPKTGRNNSFIRLPYGRPSVTEEAALFHSVDGHF